MALTLLSKTVTTAGTRERISAVSIACKQILIQVKAANTGAIYLGDATVSSTVGIQLNTPPSGQVLPALSMVPATSGTTLNLNDIWIDAAVSGNGINVFYET